MQREGSSNASSQIRNESQRPGFHFSSVTAATPAKRITFFKSGDPQFRGIRMAIHKRSFKCFDALLDDLSQRVPLPFGVRTITTPRGTHLIQHLDQLEDGGCYLCSDRHHVKPVDMEVAGKRPVVWYPSNPQNNRRKPSRPEEPHVGHSVHHYIRHPKRIVLVKNNDPAVRRSIILSRRMARSLRVFMEEISELMQCHVRKLYTLEGRKIDSIQSLMQCPNVLVCVGREPFKPLVLENLRQHSEEKLPGLGTRSHSSICSEGHESKKNVNFGLETKKSIIHPRSDSSNKSTRFSLSSEKSFPNGSGMIPGHTGSDTKEVILNDDIEKRVLVNKDGSLSVEMKVRFRLVNDETLQWSTEIKKLAPTANESTSSKDGDPQYVQSKAEYSDPDFNPACESEEACTPNLHQNHVKESCCHSCCNHSQGYDIWKNPIHKENGTGSCCSSTGSSQKMMHQRTSVDSVRTVSRSSEEYTERVRETASCFQQTVEDRDTRIEYCSISRCCSRSEVSAMGIKSKCNVPADDSCESNTSYHDGHIKPNSNLIREQSISAIGNSYKVHESFRKDQDAYDNISPSVSEWSQCDNPEQANQCPCCYGGYRNFHLSPAPPSKASNSSSHASKNKKYRCVYGAEVPNQQEDHGDVRTDSGGSSVYSRSHCFHCRQPSPSLVVFDESRATTNSHKAAVSDVNDTQGVSDDRTESGKRSGSAVSASTVVSGKSRKSTKCTCCGGSERSSALSGNLQDTQAQATDEEAKSQRSEVSAQSERTCASHRDSNLAVQHVTEVEVIHPSSESAMSDLSDLSTTSKHSNKSNRTACESTDCMDLDERTQSTMSMKSNASAKSKTSSVKSVKPDRLTASGLENQDVNGINISQIVQENLKSTDLNIAEVECKDRGVSAMSGESQSSKESEKLHISNNRIQNSSPSSEKFQENGHSERSPSAVSKNSKVSLKSNPCSVSKSRQVSKDPNSLAVTSSTSKIKKRFPSASTPKHINAGNTNHTPSVTSNTSTKSARSSKCHCSPNSINQIIDGCVQGVANSPSEKIKLVQSLSPTPYGQLDEPLSPTSTASVSLGLGEDENERSMSSVSQNLHEDICLPERPTSESSAAHGNEAGDEPNNTETNKTWSKCSSKSGTQNHNTTKAKERPSSNLEIQPTTKTVSNSDAGSITSHKTSHSDKTTCEQDSLANSKMLLNCATVGSKTSNKNMPEIHLISSGSDLIKEKTTNTKLESGGSRSNTSSSKNKQKKSNQISKNKGEDEGDHQLMPSSLPNASPTEVVNDWLRNIPEDGLMYETEEEFNEMHNESVPYIPAIQEEKSLQNEIEEPSAKQTQFTESHKAMSHEGAGCFMEDSSITGDNTQPRTEANANLSLPLKVTKSEGLSNHCQSSIQVMKVLLNPKMDRCNSLPEVSPTYGRKLSTSAKGLLDCLVNLQVIDSYSRKDKDDKLNEIISNLQSLWLSEKSEHKIKDPRLAEDEFNPRSSSGVDLSSGSTGSANGIEKSDSLTHITSQEALPQTQEDTHIEGEGFATLEITDTSHITADPRTPDIAERVRGSPEEVKLDEEAQKDEGLQATEEDILCNGNEAEMEELTATLSNGSSGNDSNALKSLTNKETTSPENTNSGTSSSGQRGMLSKRVSQDPDPVWVLSLLKKLEQQFMSHYASAIAEFKVRWDLNDNETLDVMIRELKEEVHKRIQSTINRELQKIQSRAGRTPKPPLSTLSKESSAQTEQRRRRLKIMQNKLIKSADSADMNTASGTELSDQRSDDEYCPCDVCMKKKMASRAVQRTEALSLAPVLMDFDLRKILQLKKDPPPAHCDLKEPTDSTEVKEQTNLEVVPEEAEFQNAKRQIDDTKDGRASDTVQTKDDSLDEDAKLTSENQDTEIINDGETVEEQPSNDETKEKKTEEWEVDKEGDKADEMEIETETENPEVGKDAADKSTDNKGENRVPAGAVDGLADEATEGGTLLDAQAVEEEINGTENSDAVKEGDLEEDKESKEDGRSDKETSNEDDEEGEDTGEKETSDEPDLTEDGQESGSTPEREQSEETESGNVTSDERTQDEDKDQTSTDDNEGAIKCESAEAEDDDEKPKAIRKAEDGVSEEERLGTLSQSSEQDVEQTGVEEEGIDQKHQSMDETEKQAEAPADDGPTNDDKNKDISSDEDTVEELKPMGQCDHSDCRFIQQMTKTSLESQPGSLEYSKDHVSVREKLKDIHSFIESSESSCDYQETSFPGEKTPV